MDRIETTKILAVLRAAYPAFYSRISSEDALAIVTLWSEQFAEDDYMTVSEAVKGLISTRTESYPPTIGAVKEQIQKLTEPEIPPDVAWRYVKRALQSISQFDNYEWERLPDPIKEAVTPDQLRSWGYDENFNEAVISSNFMRNYSARMKNKREFRMYTKDVQKLVAEATERLQLSIDNTMNKPRIAVERPLLIEEDKTPAVVEPKKDFYEKLRAIHEEGMRERRKHEVM